MKTHKEAIKTIAITALVSFILGITLGVKYQKGETPKIVTTPTAQASQTASPK